MKHAMPSRGAFVFKIVLAIGYTAICAVAENGHLVAAPPEMLGFAVMAITLAPLIFCGIIYALWWRGADEYQKVLEYRAMSKAALGGLGFLVAVKLTSYFLPIVEHVPSLAVVGMVMVFWISTSRNLNVVALRS
ncbi:MAG: hypothetical protein ACTHLA_04565 [Asticcacaulis sp.]|uniref:hypothetical protein n=1 Tax=Asticcacaulis sp. TaxID=1872648 RepID=UPI003F7CA2D9